MEFDRLENILELTSMEGSIQQGPLRSSYGGDQSVFKASKRSNYVSLTLPLSFYVFVCVSVPIDDVRLGSYVPVCLCACFCLWVCGVASSCFPPHLSRPLEQTSNHTFYYILLLFFSSDSSLLQITFFSSTTK